MLRARWSHGLVPWQARRFLHCLRSLRRSLLRYRKRHTDEGKLSGWRAWALALAIFLGLCSVHGTAYAIEAEIVVGPNVVTYPHSNTTGKGYIIAADNAYLAAEPILRVEYGHLSDDQKALLSNESTGGAYYAFVNKFQTMANGNYPSGGWVSSEFCAGLVSVYGSDYLYWIDYTAQEREDALRDYARILAGAVGGGGSGGLTTTLTMTPFDGVGYTTTSCVGVNERMAWTYMLGSTKYYGSFYHDSYDKPLAQQFDITVTQATLDYVTSFMDDTYDTCFAYMAQDYSLRFALIPNKDEFTPIVVQDKYVIGFNTSNPYMAFNNRVYVYNGNFSWPNSVDGLGSVINFQNSLTSGGVQLRSPSNPTWIGGTYCIAYCFFDANGMIGDEPVIPPSNWPTTPTNPTPTPPEIPTPTIPTTPVYPTINIYQDVSYVTADIAAILDALNEHCEHIQRSISDNFYDFWTVWSEQIRNEFATLEDYLHDLFVWLADQMDFSVSGGEYDDSSVVSWLKKIWLKLGTGGNSQPTDPAIDPFGWAEWLQQLLANFLDALLGLGTGAVDDVVDDLTALLGKFPFCVPWDLAAALAILDAEPIVPEFEWPMFYLDATGLHSFEVELSMEPYDEYMGGVRFMFKLIWIVVLLWKTKDAMELLKLGGASRA